MAPMPESAAVSSRAMFQDDDPEPDTAIATLPPDELLDIPEVQVRKKGEGKGRAKVEADAQRALIGGLYVMRYTRDEISRVLDVSVGTVDRVLAKLRSDKKLREGFEDTLERVNNEALPLAMESLLDHLGKHDKEMTIETLKGRGVFRNYNNTKTEGGSAQPTRTFTVNIVNAPGQAQIAVPSDAIRGVPRTLDVAAIDVPSEGT
jgi:hypothetical protein